MKNQHKKQFIGFIALAMVCVLMGTGLGMAVAQEGGTKLEGVVESPFTKAVEAVHGSVVGVSNYRTYQTPDYGYYGFGGRNRGNTTPSEPRESLAGSGSGTVISAKGHVLTNYHVIDGATRVTVTINEKEHEAEIIDYDVDLDIAILQVKDLNLPYVSLGDSDSMRIGDWAICIGNPLNNTFVGTTTVGIVSGLNRQIETGATTDKYGRRTQNSNSMIQVDASINAGNSGGGMFNVLGELMGIPTIKYSSNGYFGGTSIEGIGMCIPINVAKPLIEKALSGQSKLPETAEISETEEPAVDNTLVGKPRLGISYNAVDGSYFDSLIPSGACITKVEEGTPAKEAGLLVGDIIVEVDGTLVGPTAEALKEAISAKGAGDTVALTIYRCEGLGDVMVRYFDRESIQVSEMPTEGEYVDVTVALKIVDTITQ